MLNRKELFSFNKKTALVLVILFFVAFLVYWATGTGNATPYNYYVRLVDALLHGHLYLLDNPSWLNELVPNPSGAGYFVVYPPLPAVLMVPFVAIFGIELNQTLFGLFFSAATVVVAYLVAKSALAKMQQSTAASRRTYVWFAVLFGFGTIFWYLSSIGSVWLIAQVIATFFMMLALYECFNKNRPLLIGLLVGASFWCRLPTALGIFFFAALVISQQQNQGWINKFKASLPSLVKLALGMSVFVLLNFAYNYARYGTVFDVGYWMIPGLLDEPWFRYGHFSLLYIADNLQPFLLGLPLLTSTAPFVQFPMSGMAIWFTTPAFLFALRSKIKDKVTLCGWLCILLYTSDAADEED